MAALGNIFMTVIIRFPSKNFNLMESLHPRFVSKNEKFISKKFNSIEKSESKKYNLM